MNTNNEHTKAELSQAHRVIADLHAQLAAAQAQVHEAAIELSKYPDKPGWVGEHIGTWIKSQEKLRQKAEDDYRWCWQREEAALRDAEDLRRRLGEAVSSLRECVKAWHYEGSQGDGIMESHGPVMERAEAIIATEQQRGDAGEVKP